jgi:outer membrane protein assembly factor BamB
MGSTSNTSSPWKAYRTATVIEVNGQPQLVSPSAGATIAYAPRTGEELWRVKHGGMNAAARPLFGHGRLYVNTADGGFKLFAVRPDGSGDVTETHVDWKCNKNVASRSSQLLLGDLIFMVNEASIASCVDAASGNQLWQHRFGGDYCASPIFVDGRIYFFSEFGMSPVIEPGREFKQLAENKLDDGCMSSPAVTGQALILRTRSHLYRIEK